MKECELCKSGITHSDCPNDNNDQKETNMTTDQNVTFTPTQDQLQKIDYLRKTTIAGNIQDQPKTLEQQIWQVLEYGIRAIEQQRKQYQRTRQALREYKGR